MSYCDFEINGGTATCLKCGRVVTNAHGRIVAVCRPRGLGDIVASGLSAVGITPERVSAALGVEDCGCKKRQQKLNELGRRFGIG